MVGNDNILLMKYQVNFTPLYFIHKKNLIQYLYNVTK